MRESTRGHVLAALLSDRPASRKHLAAVTGVSAATVSRTVDQLLSEGVLREGPELVVERRGRRQVLLDIVSTNGVVVGVDLGASNTRCVVVDLLATPLASAEVETPASLDATELALWLATVIVEVAGAAWPSVTDIALGVPGAVAEADAAGAPVAANDSQLVGGAVEMRETETVSISNAPNLPQIEDAAFLHALETQLGRPVSVDNDANYALLGEQRFGAARGVQNAAMLTLGAGLGVGLAVGGHLLRGRNGLIGEFGQLPIGPLGTRLENLVTGPAIMRRAAEADLPLAEPAALFLTDTAPGVRALRAHFDQAISVVLAAIVVSCEPEVIVFGGGITKSLGPSLVGYEATLLQSLRFAPVLALAELGDFAGAAGAVATGLWGAYSRLGVDEEDLVDLPAAGTLSQASVLNVLRDPGAPQAPRAPGVSGA